MGSHEEDRSSYYPSFGGTYSEPSKPKKKTKQELAVELAKEQRKERIKQLAGVCGIKAVSIICNNYISNMLSELENKDKKLFESILAVDLNKEGINYKLLSQIVEQLTELKADMRYNVPKRSSKEYLFEDSFTGIIAVKFEGNSNSHWIAIEEGEMHDPESEAIMKNVKDVKKQFKNFDGFGHTVIFRNKQAVESLRNTYSKECRGPCDICCRKDYCRFLIY